jgi:hypothetical protein
VSVTVVDSARPSPFAASLLFSWVGNYLYDDDAPVAERRARALTLDHAQLRELLGEPDLRQLLDPLAIAQVERSLQHLDARQARTPMGCTTCCGTSARSRGPRWRSAMKETAARGAARGAGGALARYLR